MGGVVPPPRLRGYLPRWGCICRLSPKGRDPCRQTPAKRGLLCRGADRCLLLLPLPLLRLLGGQYLSHLHITMGLCRGSWAGSLLVEFGTDPTPSMIAPWRNYSGVWLNFGGRPLLQILVLNFPIKMFLKYPAFEMTCFAQFGLMVCSIFCYFEPRK